MLIRLCISLGCCLVLAASVAHCERVKGPHIFDRLNKFLGSFKSAPKREPPCPPAPPRPPAAPATGNEDVQVFIHVHCKEHWFRILEEQLHAILWSGLYDRVSAIRVYLNKPSADLPLGEADDLMRVYGPKLDLTSYVNDSSYERLTLYDIRQHVLPSTRILYMHSKGVTKGPANLAVRHWRQYMEFFLIRHWKTCLCMLDSGQYDAVGPNLRLNPPWGYPNHYSGNFWWTTGEWWAHLRPTIDEGYFHPEFHLLNNVKIRCGIQARPAHIADSAVIDFDTYRRELFPWQYKVAANWTLADAVGCSPLLRIR